MEVDTNELLHRIGAVLRGISDKMDRLIEIGERPAREIQFHEMLEDSGEHEGDHFAGADKMVADEPAKEPEPAWEPKVGDWVRVTRPDDWEGCRDPDWLPIMHEYHDKVMQVSSYENRRGAWCAKCDGVGWFFHRDWLTPSIQYFAEPPEIDKPLETEYQRPSLPKDAGKLCEFSDDGESWVKGYLKGFDCDKNWNEGIGWLCAQNFLADRAGHRYARIKKES